MEIAIEKGKKGLDSLVVTTETITEEAVLYGFPTGWNRGNKSSITTTTEKREGKTVVIFNIDDPDDKDFLPVLSLLIIQTIKPLSI